MIMRYTKGGHYDWHVDTGNSVCHRKLSFTIQLSDSKDYDFGNLCIGGFWNTSSLMNGKITNFRVVKGQALYTQGFTPPTEVFTTSSQDAESSKVKLICCNGSTTTAATNLTEEWTVNLTNKTITAS